ncbi:uncharacterized protein MELLADRAFT_63024 [Melampsora larici-populina 98AG31]|uniref:Uncharacterized protein n=1 Tax=Melampsora larici-populina (strain 98AG31 / pathotype 3-4-7) TaxID=747676 RepID=F4RL04_MELLP|nr:uncharacterized protein MELLADRAFT_63024 [Melampsora larici-populina 98AG31]EGG06947.1 hypothetical protein MELLADRAFT_63024 [Melampsora larici-populina 98AG31]
MLDQLPTEIQEAIIYYLIDLDSQGLVQVRNPYSGRSGTARSFLALSQVNWKLRRVCESFRWKTIRFSQSQDLDAQAAHSDTEYLTRNVRVLQASVLLSTPDGLFDQTCLNTFVHLKDLLDHLSQRTVKHIRLYTPAELDATRIAILNDPDNLLSKHLRLAHRQITSSLINFPLLTSLDISGVCYSFIAEDDIAQCVWQLPNLTRFRAHSSEAPSQLNDTDSIQLGESLASRCSLEYLSLGCLQGPNERWARLDWKGPLKVLSMKFCWNIQNDGLYGFISRFPTLKKIRVEGQTMELSGGFSLTDQNPFPVLESFTFSGFEVNPYIFKTLSSAPKLEKFHVHLARPRKALQEMLDCIEKDTNAWPSLRLVILSQIFPLDQQRISLENWGRERQISFKFHHRQNLHQETTEAEALTANPMEVDEQNQEHMEADDVPLGALHIETVDTDTVNPLDEAETDVPAIEGAVPDLNLSNVEEPEQDLSDVDTNISEEDLSEEEEDDFSDDQSEISVPGSDDSELSKDEDWTVPSWIRDHE